MKKEKDLVFEGELKKAIEVLNTLEPGSEEYKRQAEAIQCLMTAKFEKEGLRIKVIIPLVQTGLVVMANLLGIGAIIAFEQSGHFFTSKAFAFLVKPKV